MKKICGFLLPVLTLFVLSSCNDYGKKVKVSDRTEVYIKGKATEEDARHLGNYLDSAAASATNDRSFQLLKDDSGYTIKMVVDESTLKKDPSLDETFMMMRYLFATQVFPGTHVKMILTDNTFGDIKTVKDTTFTE